MSSRNSKVRFGIFPKLLVAMLVVAILPLGVVWYVDYAANRDQLAASVDARLHSTANELASDVDHWVEMNHKALRQNATLGDILSMDGTRQNPILKAILDEYKWTYLVFTTDELGHNIGRSDGGPLKNYTDRSYVLSVIGGAPIAKQVLIGKTSGKPAVVLASPITSPDNSRTIGVIAMAMHIEDLSNRITNTQIGTSGFAFILDESGKVVAHQQQGNAPTMTDMSDHPTYHNRPTKDAIRLVFDANGKKIISSVQRTKSGWYVIAQQDYDEAYEPLHAAEMRGLVLLGITVLAVGLIAYLVAMGLSRPIRRLTTIADQLSHGAVVGDIKETGRGDEIGLLAAAIERMGASVRLAMSRLRKAA